MAEHVHHETAPADRIPLGQKLLYGLGAFVNNLLAAASGGMMIVLNLALGMNPALVGMLGAIPRLVDTITDPLMGFISDHTRTRWGRRRPWILLGALFAGISFAVLWNLPEGQSEDWYYTWFLVGSIIFFLGYTMYATPWVALGYELTPDYHERTRLMGVQNFLGQIAYLLSPWFLWFMQREQWFDSMVAGAATLALLVAVATIVIGILLAVFIRERMFAIAQQELAEADPAVRSPLQVIGHNIVEFLRAIFYTLTTGPFLLLAIATFLVFNGFMLVSSFQIYVIIYYVFGGDQALGAEYAGYAGTVSAVFTFIAIVITTWLATRIGKRHTFFWCISISIVGYGLKWFCYDPDVPWLVVLPAPLMAFGLGALFTLMGSMIADVCDLDELRTGQRREGMFGATYWFMVKVGMTVALAASGYLLNATGFDVALEGNQSAEAIYEMRLYDALVPMAGSIIAIIAVAFYPITEERAAEVRAELEARRGVAA